MATKDTEKILRMASGTVVGEETAMTATPAVIAGFTAEPTAAPVGGTGATAGAYDTAANRDTAITCINDSRTRIAELVTEIAKFDTLRTRLNEVESILQKFGLVK